ncbi:MAG: hypothetical protein ACREIC_16800, partial [Limisphaerales bacterium]
ITDMVDGTSCHFSTLPAEFHSSVVDELGRMGAVPSSPFPKEGEIFVRLETTQLRWKFQISSPDADIVLTPSDEP